MSERFTSELRPAPSTFVFLGENIFMSLFVCESLTVHTCILIYILLCEYSKQYIFYLMTHSTHFNIIIIRRRTYDKGPFRHRAWNPLPPLHGLLFSISSKGSFISTIPQTGQHIPRPLLHYSRSTGWNVKHFNGSTISIIIMYILLNEYLSLEPWHTCVVLCLLLY